VHVVPVNVADVSLRETAESLADALEASGVDTLLDDREERPGVKFKDADLIGLPVRVTVGTRALARGCVEVKARAAAEAVEVPVSEVAARVAAQVGPR
jgi:prolyl-tRNA synthetase